MTMQIPGLHRSSLDPPALSAADDAAAAHQAEKLPWVLLEVNAYVARRDNATTVFSDICDGKRIQVTMCARRPPSVSYVCVHSPDAAAEINVEPYILATKEDMILLCVSAGRKGDDWNKFYYYVYQADGPDGPSLAHLPSPPYCFGKRNAGILRYRNDHTGGEEYVVAALYHTPLEQPVGEFDLILYDSRHGHWKTHKVSLEKPQQRRRHGGGKKRKPFSHSNCMVVTIGGDAGTMAFVDLWRGILFCDVLTLDGEAARRVEGEGKPMPLLRYVAVPEPLPLQRNYPLRRDARLYRNVAMVGDRLKYVELQPHRTLRGGPGCKYFVHNGWTAATWSRPATSSSSEDDHGWRQDTSIRDSSTALKVPNTPDFKHLASNFKRFGVCQPVLGLQDDDADIVYFTVKMGIRDDDAGVAAVDLRKEELLGVATFPGASRYVGIDFTYVHSRISKHLR